MPVNGNPTGLVGTVICGQKLAACDEDSAYAIYPLTNCYCGVTFEEGSNCRPYLRLAPGVQIPDEVRSDFARMMFESDDERLADLNLDQYDGEVTMRVRVSSLEKDEVERELSSALEWVDKSGYPAVMRYVTNAIARLD